MPGETITSTDTATSGTQDPYKMVDPNQKGTSTDTATATSSSTDSATGSTQS
jgi:hypothetical protein